MTIRTAADVSVNVPSSGVTNVIPEEGESEVVVTQSADQPAQTDLRRDTADMPGFPMEWDENSESLFGQTSGSPTDRAGAAMAIKTGNLSALENLSFGVTGDGAPAVGFMDENGMQQVIRVTPGEWLTRLSNRDLARREMQFQVDADKKRKENGVVFNSVLNQGNFSEGDRRMLQLAWRMDPDNAMKVAEATRQANAEDDYNRRLVGGEAVFGEDYSTVLEQEFGVSDLAMLTPAQWRELNQDISNDERLMNRRVMVHGEGRPFSAAQTVAEHLGKNTQRANIVAAQLAENYGAGRSSLKGNEASYAQIRTSPLATYAYGAGLMALPEDATILQSPSWMTDSKPVLATLVASAIMSQTFTGSVAAAAGVGDDPAEIELERLRLAEAVNTMSSSIGWAAMSPEQLSELLIDIGKEAKGWLDNVGGVTLYSAQQAASNAAAKVAEEKRIEGQRRITERENAADAAHRRRLEQDVLRHRRSVNEAKRGERAAYNASLGLGPDAAQPSAQSAAQTGGTDELIPEGAQVLRDLGISPMVGYTNKDLSTQLQEILNDPDEPMERKELIRVWVKGLTEEQRNKLK
jgi:hypothetical protein